MELERHNERGLSRRRLITAGAGLAAAGGVSGLLAASGDVNCQVPVTAPATFRA